MKVIIVGAGIAGLAAGIYARQSGFEVTIYESHTVPGGASTSWRRKGYLFEGGLHWLTGSSPKTPLHKLWREVGALDERVKIHLRDPFLLLRRTGSGPAFTGIWRNCAGIFWKSRRRTAGKLTVCARI